MSTRYDIEVAMRGHDQGLGTLLDRTAQKLRAIHAEERKSGEGFLKQAVRGGPQSLVESGAELIGAGKAGLAGLAIEQVAGSIDKVTESLRGVREGTKSWGSVSQDVVRSLPFGIGAIAGAVRDLLDEVTGVTAAEDRFVKSLERASEAQKLAVEGAAKTGAALRTMRREQELNLEAQRYGGGTDTYQKEQGEMEARHAARLQQLADLRTEINGANLDPHVYNKRMESLHEREADAQREYENDQSNLAGEHAKRQNEEHLRAQEELLRNDAQYYQKTLEGSGEFLEAQIAQIRENAREKLAALDEEKRQQDEATGPSAQRDADFDARRAAVREQMGLDVVYRKEEAKRNARRIEADSRATERAEQERYYEASLRSQGKFNEAELAAVEAHTAANIEQIKLEYAERIRLAASLGEKQALYRKEQTALAAAANSGSQEGLQAQLAALDRQYGGSHSVAATSVTRDFHGLAQISQDQSMAQKRTKTLELMLGVLTQIKNQNAQGGFPLGYNP